VRTDGSSPAFSSFHVVKDTDFVKDLPKYSNLFRTKHLLIEQTEVHPVELRQAVGLICTDQTRVVEVKGVGPFFFSSIRSWCADVGCRSDGSECGA